MSIWQLASVRRYLHCLKVDGDGEENQCGCKQRNGRVMCSPGQAMQKKPCQGNTERRLNSLVFLPALPTATFNPHTHLSSWSQSSRLSFPAASRNANSAEPANQSAGWNGKQECKWARLDSHMQRGDVLDGDWWCLFLFILFITKHTHTHTQQVNRVHANLTCFHLSCCGSIREAWVTMIPGLSSPIGPLNLSIRFKSILSPRAPHSLNYVSSELVGSQHCTDSIAMKS